MRAASRPAGDSRTSLSRVAGLSLVTVLVLIAVLLLPPVFAAGMPAGPRYVERVEGRSVDQLENGFVFVSAFAAVDGARIRGGYLEYTDGFYTRFYATEVHHEGAYIRFVLGIECGAPVTVTFHVLYLTPEGTSEEYVRALAYHC